MTWWRSLPPYDPTGITSIAAAGLMQEFISHVAYKKEKTALSSNFLHSTSTLYILFSRKIHPGPADFFGRARWILQAERTTAEPLRLRRPHRYLDLHQRLVGIAGEGDVNFVELKNHSIQDQPCSAIMYAGGQRRGGIAPARLCGNSYTGNPPGVSCAYARTQWRHAPQRSWGRRGI